ncbi:MAG: glycosyltransferase family 1 protein [Nostocaceae cyanobacterium]|nr:glycosyltransferase family 1 protein [Nostocaceae cyanobacterium]
MLEPINNYMKANKAIPGNQNQPLRVLHVLGGMNRGGIETWLMHILRHIDRDRVQMDFIVGTTEPGSYDEEARSLGCRIIPCLHPSKPLMYAANFKRILREYGPYDIVHSHVHFFSGYVLRVAQRSGISIRIAHSHNNTAAAEAAAGWSRRWYLNVMQSWINKYATAGLACSSHAAVDLFGTNWNLDPRWQVLSYGINLAPFQQQLDKLAVRAKLGIPEDAFVIGHVGRFVEQKNHKFLLEIAAEVAKKEPKMYLLLLGEGTLQPDVKQQAVQLGIADRTIFTGSRPDVPNIMLGAMDAFLFPSHHEGLGLVLVEAQAAGLPCIFSDVVPPEADVVKPLVNRLSLSKSATDWATQVLVNRDAAIKLSQASALKLTQTSQFNIATSVQELENFYQSQLAKVAAV